MMMKNKVQQIHFIGIGGIGMSGIAEVLHNLGYQITGSDVANNHNTEHLARLGVKIFIGHSEANLDNVNVVVISSAIKANNPELIAARNKSVPIIPRAKMLAELMRFKHGIAVAGTHGKTTTTSMMAEVYKECGLDPTFIIGGKLVTIGTNAKLGDGDYLIAEADESDASFLYLKPMLAVVTNIDLDHMDTYNHDENQLKKAFVDFLNAIPFYGLAVVCGEDARILSIVNELTVPVVTYGLSDQCDLYASDIKAYANTMSYTLNFKLSSENYPITVNMPGVHNVLNSLAVIACALDCGGKIQNIAHALYEFSGVDRRSQRYPEINYQNKQALLIDDYGHHPAELKATISALKTAYPQHRMVVIFQPHRYTRTRDLFDDFVEVLSFADCLIITEVYAAGENVIVGYDGEHLANAIKARGKAQVYFARELGEARDTLYNIINNNDLVLTMGAGSIAKLPTMLVDFKD